jgi:lysophospholipase L1-like esterase
MISRSLPSDRRTPLVYVALGDSTVYGLGASSPNTHYVARLFASLQWEYPAARLSNLATPLATAADVLAQQPRGNPQAASADHALGWAQRSAPGSWPR